MSCYEWENGAFTIPSAQWAGLKKSIRDAYNKAVEEDFALLTAIVATVKLATKGRRNMNSGNLQSLLYDVYENGFSKKGKTLKVIPAHEVFFPCEKGLISKDTGKLLTPKRSHMPFANSATKSLGYQELSVDFDEKTRRVLWSIYENNHAVDQAHESFLGKLVMGELKKINWTRGSGGYTVGNNEYNRDNRDAGGGSNYLGITLGPLGEAEYKRHHGFEKPKENSRAFRLRY